MRRLSLPLAVLLSIGICAFPAAAQIPPPEPLELGLEEQVEVQLVLVDLLVLDRKDRTVSGLTIDDFLLVVDGRDVEIASLDADCPVGAAEDPRPGSPSVRLSGRRAATHRVVLVFDYFHMTNVAEAFEYVDAALERWPTGDTEHMVVSLGDFMRLETPFTDDVGEVRATLRHMRDDPDLYAGNHWSLTEFRFFERIEMLFDLLERVPGRKMVVLLSGPFLPDGFTHDSSFRRLSAMSVASRTAVYPVDTGGLRTLIDPFVSRLGGPATLRRLANETGGRMTADTNDLGLAYARARRDLGCTYTLGFYDERPRLDDRRRLTIRVRDRPGLRAVYPEFYVIRSPSAKRESLFRTAVMTPQLFESDELSADLLLVAPRAKGRWETSLEVDIRLGPDHTIEEGEPWVLRGLVRKPNGTIVGSFKRRVSMPAPAADGRVPEFRVTEPLRVRPGRYQVSAVLSDPNGASPLATTRFVEIGRGPRDPSGG